MNRLAGVALASSVVVGVAALLVFDAAWEFDVDDGWGLGPRNQAVLHGLGIALGLVWLGVFVWGLVELARLLHPSSPVTARLAIVLSAVGAVAGVGVVAFQIYLLTWLARTSEARGDAFLDVLLRVRDLELPYLGVAAVASLSLVAALTALAFGAARAGLGWPPAAWAVVLLPVAWTFVDWMWWVYAAAVLLFGLSLTRARRKPVDATAVA